MNVQADSKVRPGSGRFNVYIIRASDGKAISRVGENLSEDRAFRRECTALGRIDRDNYFVGSEEVGSEGDAKCAAEYAEARANALRV